MVVARLVVALSVSFVFGAVMLFSFRQGKLKSHLDTVASPVERFIKDNNK